MFAMALKQQVLRNMFFAMGAHFLFSARSKWPKM
jgi:hypothetical protein